MNANYDITIGVLFSLAASLMIVVAAIVVGIVMVKETKKMK